VADPGVPDLIMPVAQMRPLLKLAQEPDQRVPCVVGLDVASEGVILLARNGTAKKLRSVFLGKVEKQKLSSKIKTDNQSLYHGYASTDAGAEAILKITLSRSPVGAEKLASRLLRRVKATGFSDVVFTVDENINNEKEEDDATRGTRTGGTSTSEETEGAESERQESRSDQAGTGMSEAEKNYHARLAKLTPDLAHALREQIGDTGKIRAVAEFAREKAAGGTWDAALKALDALEKLLAPPTSDEGSDANAMPFPVERFRKLQDDWLASKQRVNKSLSVLHDEIITEFDDPDSTSAADNLARILARFTDGLGDTLDAFCKAGDPATRSQLVAKVGRIADMYLAYLNVEPLIAHVEANPYDVEVAVKATLSEPLTAVKAELAKLAA
jgi:hypothetical protein